MLNPARYIRITPKSVFFGEKLKLTPIFTESMRKIINSMNRSLYRETKALMMHWGFGETCSSIYALLFVSEEPLTAKEVADELGYAYSSMINELNKLRRESVISRERKGRKYAYSARKDVDSILIRERERTRSILKGMDKALDRHSSLLGDDVRDSVKRSIEMIENRPSDMEQD